MMAGSEQIDRRALIKGAAVAGAAAWTAPMIVDSLASPAAAASTSHNYACSKGYIFYTITGSPTVYYTGFKQGTPLCNQCGANPPGGNDFNGCSVTNVCLFKGSVSGTCADNGPFLKYTLGTTSCSDPAAMTSAVFDPNCSSHVSLDSGTGKIATGAAGVTLLGGFAFTGGNWFNVCPSAGTPGNSITMPGGCNDA
jgi:hypothetical protein